MEQRIVRDLEDRIAEAIADAIMGYGDDRLPDYPTDFTRHMMAKAAVAVYEATVGDEPR